MQDDLGQDVNEAMAFGYGDKLVREDEAGLLQTQAHQRLRRIKAAGFQVENRLAVSQNPRVFQIPPVTDIGQLTQDVFLAVAVGQYPRVFQIPPVTDIGQLTQDVFLAVEAVDILRGDAVHGVLIHDALDTPDQTGIFIFPADLVNGFADDNLEGLLKMLSENADTLPGRRQECAESDLQSPDCGA